MSFLHRKLITVLNNFFQKNSSTVTQCSRVQQHLYRNCDAKIRLFDEKSKRNNRKSPQNSRFLTFYIYIDVFMAINIDVNTEI